MTTKLGFNIFSDNVNMAYGDFLDTFKKLYDYHCPVRKICLNSDKLEINLGF